ncbi:MAG: hypothetical protein FD119_3511 [Stygiobacter sp.]|nr:MAG: hypothetical protein FD119_3511 [Stygiobacter sp.]
MSANADVRRRELLIYRITPFSLLLLLILRPFYHGVRYVVCSPRMASLVGPFLRRVGARQVLARSLYQGGRYHQALTETISRGTHAARSMEPLAAALVALGNDPRYHDTLVQAIIEGGFREFYLSTFLDALSKREPTTRFDVIAGFSLKRFGPTPPGNPRHMVFLRWHRILMLPALLLERVTVISTLLLFPVLNVAMMLRKGVRLFAPSRRISRKETLYFHIYSDQPPIDDGRFERLWFPLQSGALQIDGCCHMPMALSAKMGDTLRTYIQQHGGDTLDRRDLAMPNPIADGIRYWRIMTGPILRLAFNPFATLRFLRHFTEYLHLMSLVNPLLDAVGCRRVYFTTEPTALARVIGIEGRKRGVTTIGISHGTGISALYYPARANMQYDIMLTPGQYFRPLQEISPGIPHFIPIGNPECDLFHPNQALLPPMVSARRQEIKVIGFFVDLQSGFIESTSCFPGYSYFESQTIDWDEVAAHVERQLAPLFDWIASHPDTVLLWKPKRPNAALNEDHPIIRPLLARIPASQMILAAQRSIEETIGLCDVCIASAYSSVVGAAMTHDIPVVTLDHFYGAAERRYHPRMSAETGPELVDNLEWVLTNSYPSTVFDTYRQDFYAYGLFDGKTSLRLASALASLNPVA